MGEPEQRHGPLPRNSGSTRTVGSVAEELAAAQGSSQVGCWLLWRGHVQDCLLLLSSVWQSWC